MATTTTPARCSGSGRSFPIPEGVDLRGKKQAPCPGCNRTMHVVRWNSVKQTMVIAIHTEVR